jgi:hypothetical protein
VARAGTWSRRLRCIPTAAATDGSTRSSGDLAELPAWLRELLAPKCLPHANFVNIHPAKATSYGQAALHRELERVSRGEPGTRNHQLNRAAFRLGQLVAAHVLDEEVAVAELVSAGTSIGLGLRECERTVASGITEGCSSRGRWGL